MTSARSTSPLSPATTLPTFTLDHVALRISDYESSARWYVDCLGFDLVQEWSSGELQLGYLVRGAVKLELMGGAEPSRQERATDLASTFGAERVHHLCLAVDNLEATIEALRERGVELLGEPFVVADIARQLAFIQDPSGNLIEFSAPVALH